MTDLTFTLLRLGYLALLCVFVWMAIRVLMRDLSGGQARPRPSTKRPSANGAKAAEPAPLPAPAGPTHLVVTEGPLTGSSLPLTTSPILIGRAPSCTLVLDDDYSSSRHARIFPRGDHWFVEDLGSTNGTLVADQRIDSVIGLPMGVPVRIGQSVVELRR